MIPSPERQKQVRRQNEARRLWREHDTLDVVHDSLLNESLELAEAVGECEIGQSAFAVVSEIGDVYYLYIKYIDMARIAGKEIPLEISEAMDYAEEVCNLTGIDVNEAIKMKIVRNGWKYQDYLMNNGYSYGEAVNICKQLWKEMGGDYKFSQMYEEVGDLL